MYSLLKALKTKMAWSITSPSKFYPAYIPLFCFMFLFFVTFPSTDSFANVQIVETLSDGLIMQFDLPELKIDKKEINGEIFNSVSYENCSFTHEFGKPQVPIYTAILGIPEQSMPTISILSSNYNLMSGYKLPIINDPEINSNIDSKLKNDFYPLDYARISPMGYMRQQRIASLGLHPIQYNHITGQLKVCKSLKFGIKFNSTQQSYSYQNIQTDAYEDIYRESLLNYDQARKWRQIRAKTNLAPQALQQPAGTQGISYKIVINKNGIYRLDYRYLVSAGIDPSSIDPRKIEIKSSGKEIPIYVEGYQDGKFDPEDYIEFYGTSMNSLYTNDNVYWLTWATKENPNVKSWMMAVKDGEPMTISAIPPIAFKTTERFEENKDYDPLKRVNSETADHFFWRPFRGQDIKYNKTAPIAIDIPHRAPNMNQYFTLRVCFQGITYAKGASRHIMKIYLNGKVLDTVEWEGANEFISESVIKQYDVNRLNWLELECLDNNDSRDDTDPKWDLYLNWYEIDYWREYVAKGDLLEFSTETFPPVTKDTVFSISSLSSSEVTAFQIDKSNAIAKITNLTTKKVGNTYTASFEDYITQPTRYIVVTKSSIMRPKSISKDEPSTLHNPANNIDYIMITHNKFRKSTERLADYRRKQGLNVLVVDVDDIYDEFNYGIFDPKAIKRFLRYAYFNWAKMPTYVLLVGDAHWDYKYVYDEYYKKYENYPLIYVPTYHGPSQPYGQTAMDDRFVAVSGDDIIPDMILGRMPVETEEEANNIIDKTIEYEANPNYGVWQSKIMLVADDEKSKSGDEVFEDSRRLLANYYIPVGYEVLDVYLRKLVEPYLAKKAIINGIEKGILLLEFSGHGGSYYWTHENIFDGNDVKKLKNKIYPVVITTTCENGYFDNPFGGNKTLIDIFLMKEKSGAVACFSATRLTYGQGNAVFDQKLYPRIFNTTPPTLGKILNLSKIDFIKLDIPAWTSTIEQYIIFGDPALKIALPELKIDCELSKTSVSSASNINIKNGYVKQPKFNQATGKTEWITDTDFNGQMRISVIYPNNLDDNDMNNVPIQYENTKISKGQFKDISIKIPNNIKSGRGQLRLYANNIGISAIGGLNFSISEPVIEQNISKFIGDDGLGVYVAITDNLDQAGIKSVECNWRNTENWVDHTIIMKIGQPPQDAPQIEGLWFVLSEIIPLSKPGTKIDYWIKVIDTEGNDIRTEAVSVKVPIGVNLIIPKPTAYMPPDISYTYSTTDKSWLLSVPVENEGSKEIKLPVGVYFFEGNPDRNNDQAVDMDAQILGMSIIKYEDWERFDPSADSPVQKALAITKLKNPLFPGFHQIFVWINPRISKPYGETVVDKVDEADDMDNIGSKLFQINEFLIGNSDSDTYAQSLDGTLKILIPAGSVDETIMSITRLSLPQSEWKQTDITPAPMPSDSIRNGAFKIQLSSGATIMKKNAQVDVRFDVTKLREIAKKAKGLGNKKDSLLTHTEREWIDIATQEEAKKLGVYMWLEDLGVWRYIPSEIIMSDSSYTTKQVSFLQEYYVTLPTTDNKSSASFDTTNVKIDEISTPIGNWVILFLDPDRYKVYFRREGALTYESLSRYGEVGKLYSNVDVGLQITMYKEESNYSFGDIYKFDTYRELDGSIKIKGMKYFNEGDGTAHITIMDKDEPFVSQTTGNWVIFFINSKNFEIHSQQGIPVTDDTGDTFIGTLGKELYIPSIGIKLEISDGKYPYEFGDKFVFQTLFIGTVRAKINQVKTLSLMHCNDIIQPNVELWVNGKIPKSGAVIPPRPAMSLMLSDVNGIDINSFSFIVSVNDREFNQVPKGDYVLSDRSQLDSIPIFYSPILNIGKYRYRISVKDFNGNISKSVNGDFLEFMFLVEEKPDLSSPDINITIDGKILMNGETLKKSPSFNISINDDYALDTSKIVVSMAHISEKLIPLNEKEYSTSISNDLKNVNIVYSPKLMNGEYAIQIQAEDTSKNIAYLVPPELEPFKFVIDEEVKVSGIINSPNPFSDTTVFSYYLTQPADKATVKIYSLKGKLIRTLIQDSPSWKYNEIYWDSKDEEDNKLASGVYFYKFIVNNNNKKMEKIGKLAIIR